MGDEGGLWPSGDLGCLNQVVHSLPPAGHSIRHLPKTHLRSFLLTDSCGAVLSPHVNSPHDRLPS